MEYLLVLMDQKKDLLLFMGITEINHQYELLHIQHVVHAAFTISPQIDKIFDCISLVLS